MTQLILMRHGQSQWNDQNIFTGWVDIPLSLKGIAESLEAGVKMSARPIDLVYTSCLVRAEMSALIALTLHQSRKVPVILHPGEGKMEEWAQIYGKEAKAGTLPVMRAWELNERMYGELQGMNKADMASQYGAEQVHIWRRSFDTAPPKGESLKMTAERTLPFFKKEIIPALAAGKNVFVSAHGNSLRAMMMEIEGLSTEEVLHLELATGTPIIYHYDGNVFQKE